MRALGRAAFQELELTNKWTGQFFTPYDLCRFMAKMQISDDMRQVIAERGFIRANEPACGAGAMIIALCTEMKAAGINYQKALHFIAQDIDIRAVHMTYLQLSLLHCPAVIVHGNTPTLEERSRWYTPAHILGFWNGRLRDAQPADLPSAEPDDEQSPQQLLLF